MSREIEIARVRLERGKDVNRWIVDDCPFCGKQHYHGAGKSEGPLILGGRQSHCSPGGQYILEWWEGEEWIQR